MRCHVVAVTSGGRFRQTSALRSEGLVVASCVSGSPDFGLCCGVFRPTAAAERLGHSPVASRTRDRDWKLDGFSAQVFPNLWIPNSYGQIPWRGYFMRTF